MTLAQHALSTFTFNQYNIRTFLDSNSEPWFLANDVCSVLGYVNPRQAVQKNCKPKGVSNRDTPTSGGIQSMLYINEPNLYRLIIKSRKPEAEAFENWVMEEVLPTIRKTGQYQQPIAQPPVHQTISLNLSQEHLYSVIATYIMAHHMNELLLRLVPALKALGSSYAGTAWSQAYEYSPHIQERLTLFQDLAEHYSSVNQTDHTAWIKQQLNDIEKHIKHHPKPNRTMVKY